MEILFSKFTDFFKDILLWEEVGDFLFPIEKDKFIVSTDVIHHMSVILGENDVPCIHLLAEDWAPVVGKNISLVASLLLQFQILCGTLLPPEPISLLSLFGHKFIITLKNSVDRPNVRVFSSQRKASLLEVFICGKPLI